ncbi:DUF4158 domain-containing protein [Actinomadura oligospora]|uniref:DUF4158 domain-containing protein n=1 Tax=Actinomadura oligospora TaxID=111804 RepID=UPI0009FCEDC4
MGDGRSTPGTHRRTPDQTEASDCPVWSITSPQVSSVQPRARVFRALARHRRPQPKPGPRGPPLTYRFEGARYESCVLRPSPCYAGAPSRADLERVFFLDDGDRALVEARGSGRGAASRRARETRVRPSGRDGPLVGAFLEDPLDVAGALLDFVAEQLGIADASQVKKYIERTRTRFDHQWEIRRTYELKAFAAVVFAHRCAPGGASRRW